MLSYRIAPESKFYMLTKSKIQTQKLAGKLARKILKAQSSKLKAGIVIALQGNLGSGKTTFTQGFMKALGARHRITSPTFIIYRKYSIFGGRTSPKFKKYQEVRPPEIDLKFVYHFDLYRINKPKEILNLGFRKIINNPENIVLIEWPEIIKKILPQNTIWINFEHGKNQKERIIKIGD